MNLFYHPQLQLSDTRIYFGKDESRHIHRVLRKKEGDVLHITNGKGIIFSAELNTATPKESEAVVIDAKEITPLPYRLHIAIAPTKNNDRFEWFLEKVTEIGVHAITPMFCDRSERRTIKPERLERIIESAMKQSLKAYKPVLNEAVSFSNFVKLLTGDHSLKYLAHCEDSPKEPLASLIQPKKEVLVMIGPEGDFSPAEIEIALANGVVPVNLGESRLRTETAGMVACHTVALLNQID